MVKVLITENGKNQLLERDLQYERITKYGLWYLQICRKLGKGLSTHQS